MQPVNEAILNDIQSQIDKAKDDNSEPPQYAYTDLGNGERFRDQHGENVRYVYAADKWYLWDAKRWQEDEGHLIQQLAKDTALSIRFEPATDVKRRAAFMFESQQSGKLSSMLKRAQSETPIPVTFDRFDARPFLLNIANGTVDLRTGQLHEHRREDYHTKIIPIEYHQNVECPAFEKFIYTAMGGDQDSIDYLQRAVGYSLTGSTSEKCLFFLHGKTDTGKTVFLELLRYMFGEYGATTSSGTLAAKQSRDNRIPNDLARLHGARIILASEGEQGDFLHEGMIKSFTGGDTITARFLRQEYFEFRPVGKIWFGTNHVPRFHGGDSALERRIRLVPFNVQVPRSKQNANLLKQLKTEAEGILNWMIKGCLDWQRVGLQPPEKIKAATEQLVADNDDIQQFIDECCVVGPDAEVSRPALYAKYKSWSAATGRGQLGERAFISAMEPRGFYTDRQAKKRFHGFVNAQRFWVGIDLED